MGGDFADHFSQLKYRSITRSHGTGGPLSGSRLCLFVLPSAVTFICVELLQTSTTLSPSLVKSLTIVVAVLALLEPIFTNVLLLLGCLRTICHARVRGSAMLFWMWWPLWRLLLPMVAIFFAYDSGSFLYKHYLFPHMRLQQLQGYSDVDPSIATGKRLQDSGVLEFNASAGVDRARSGCVRESGLYCVAPVVLGGVVQNSSASHPQDLFVVGTDCCGCPGEFRCGAWNIPGAVGGLRILDTEKIPHYVTAAQEWGATFGKSVQKPLFYEWVADPLVAFNEMGDQGVELKMLSLLAGPVALFLVGVLLNLVMALLCRLGLAAPVDKTRRSAGIGHMFGSASKEANYDSISSPQYVIL